MGIGRRPGYRYLSGPVVALLALGLQGCGQMDESTANDDGDAYAVDHGTTDAQPPGPSEQNATMFASKAIVDYFVTAGQDDWDRMIESAYKGEEVYIPCDFEHDGDRFEHAAMRLKGNITDWLPDTKLQFVVRFNWYDKAGRFRGLRRVFLEANPNDPSTCRNTLSLHVMRESGAVTPRSNHARLYVNGVFYGLYENIEYVDREFLEDRFAFPGGNLYKNGEFLKTNESVGDTSDLEALNEMVWDESSGGDHTDFYAGIQKTVDMDALLLHVAVEAILPAGDCFWSGGWNYYWYHDPLAGFVILPWDLDDVMNDELAPTDADPLTWTSVAAGDLEPHPLWALARENQAWRKQFLSNLDRIDTEVYSGLDGVAKECCARVWPDLANDPNYAFDKGEFDEDCQYLQDHVVQRSVFIRSFIESESRD